MLGDEKPFYVPADEQETVIQFSKRGDVARIWTSDQTMITKYDKFVASGEWSLEKIDYVRSSIVAKQYSAPKSLVFGQSKRRTMSDEQKQQKAELMRALRASQLSQSNDST